MDRERIAELCRRHHIRRLALFGSVLRDDFRPDSDVDVLVDFEPGAPIGLREFLEAQDELQVVFGRPVDLVEKERAPQSLPAPRDPDNRGGSLCGLRTGMPPSLSPYAAACSGGLIGCLRGFAGLSYLSLVSTPINCSSGIASAVTSLPPSPAALAA